MANKYFRQVLCSERLPKLEGPYDTNCGRLHFVPKIDMFDTSIVEWWYEPIELPSEKEKQVIVKEAWETKDVDPSSFMAGFNKAIELIKGEGLNNG